MFDIAEFHITFFALLKMGAVPINALFSRNTSFWNILKLLMLYEYIKLDINDPERVEIVCSQQLLLSGKVAIMVHRLICGYSYAAPYVENI
ncbi:enterobactin synthase subunit E [Photorhabdus australis subsp. thailandensis]|uniref:Enterobactin synthase subunit E n=1 Tax=Photorhabdus australis subsp. thailandensis TaxID=2805096 RepID=A0A1C0U4I7_9GAMM|nr:enterobactin synthase subunit E [Photorhabdus australis subsp. thailandensis]